MCDYLVSLIVCLGFMLFCWCVLLLLAYVGCCGVWWIGFCFVSLDCLCLWVVLRVLCYGYVVLLFYGVYICCYGCCYDFGLGACLMDWDWICMVLIFSLYVCLGVG